jgi:hypothetical protein
MSLWATMDCLTWVHVLDSNGLSRLTFPTLLFVSISDRALFDGSILPQSILGCLKHESRLFEPLDRDSVDIVLWVLWCGLTIRPWGLSVH